MSLNISGSYPVCLNKSITCTIDHTFWNMLFKATKDSEWTKITNYYEKNPNIDINYTPDEGENQGLSILLLTVLHKQLEMAKKMLTMDPDFSIIPTQGLHKGKSVPLLLASASEKALLEDIITSGKFIDYNIGPQEGLSTYWIMANNKWWDLIKIVHKQKITNLPIDLAPNNEQTKGKTPFWLASNAREYDIVLDMLSLNPNANLESSPAVGPNQKKTALWFIIKAKECAKREAAIETLLFLGAKIPDGLAGNFRTMLNKIMHCVKSGIEGNAVGDDHLKFLIVCYPQLSLIPFPVLIQKILERAKEEMQE